MSAKTKILVFRMKEVVYTGIFALLGILFIILLITLFVPKKAGETETAPPPENNQNVTTYTPGVYTTSLLLGDNSVDIEVVVDADYINSVRLVNLSEAIATMYPLIAPSFDELATQIYQKQSLENISYSEDNKYTSQVLLEAIRASLDKAKGTS
jgi:uncharacterized protein with FMN-binding domain